MLVELADQQNRMNGVANKAYTAPFQAALCTALDEKHIAQHETDTVALQQQVKDLAAAFEENRRERQQEGIRHLHRAINIVMERSNRDSMTLSFVL